MLNCAAARHFEIFAQQCPEAQPGPGGKAGEALMLPVSAALMPPSAVARISQFTSTRT